MEKLKITFLIREGFTNLKKNPYMIVLLLVSGGLFFAFSNFGQGIPEFSNAYLVNIVLLNILNLFIASVATLWAFDTIVSVKVPSPVPALKKSLNKFPIVFITAVIFCFLSSLGLIFLIIPGIIIGIKLCFYIPLILLDNRNPIKSIKSSWFMTSGNTIRLIALLLFFYFIGLLIYIPFYLINISFTLTAVISSAIFSAASAWLTYSFVAAYLQLKKIKADVLKDIQEQEIPIVTTVISSILWIAVIILLGLIINKGIVSFKKIPKFFTKGIRQQFSSFTKNYEENLKKLQRSGNISRDKITILKQINSIAKNNKNTIWAKLIAIQYGNQSIKDAKISNQEYENLLHIKDFINNNQGRVSVSQYGEFYRENPHLINMDKIAEIDPYNKSK